ncbi:YqcC family protein [Vibrio aestuarianus]|uniref:YqcC family protein n=1 Tax=Vibrio aestuarianus TaxID=28171 RepID=A0A9X4F8Z5_9VIBR|nr:YqcC family protein [Vibrio aestuarianus]MDE1209600.1 YqcC family protein [Vibrio aestuarianus]MDE1219945.1 YqcC family protein [Vibrio aestuarianus]MDE1225359.1 YqcC family protein [Vibrio aestuarianus]MDE1232213.1 YqcC family protein [Vibrio aestuarianus]MDE1234682.1 YqcC family protein [Vibrio aestuarianus]
MTINTELARALTQLETELRQCGVWQPQSPSREALMSNEPFAIDTLAPEQWLQWVFIPKMLALLEQQATLPSGFSIAPYFEETWKHQPEFSKVIALVTYIDEVCKAC